MLNVYVPFFIFLSFFFDYFFLDNICTFVDHWSVVLQIIFFWPASFRVISQRVMDSFFFFEGIEL